MTTKKTANSVHSADVTQQDFDALVLEKSAEVPVVVDFWAAWCGPCQILMPLLAKLADEYQGKFFLAKVNTDQERALAARYGVRSLPTVKLFKNGEIVDEFMGAVPERTIRQLLDRHLPRESDALIYKASLAHQGGETDKALELLATAAGMDPANDRVKLQLAKILLETGRIEEGERELKAISASGRDDPEAVALLARLEFLRVAAGAPARDELERALADNPKDNETRYQLSACYVRNNEYEPALAQLLEIVRTDRKFREDAGRKGMLSIFNILGGKGDLVKRYRTRLSLALN